MRDSAVTQKQSRCLNERYISEGNCWNLLYSYSWSFSALSPMLIRFKSHSEAERLLKPAVAGFETLEGLQGEHTTSNMETLLEVLLIEGEYDELGSLRQEWFKSGVQYFKVVRLSLRRLLKASYYRTMATKIRKAWRRHGILEISRLML